jgi:GTP cyclohydrolase I
MAQACVPDPDAMLRDLLVQAIEECMAWVGRDPARDAVLDTDLWVTACQRTGGSPAATMPEELARH